MMLCRTLPQAFDDFVGGILDRQIDRHPNRLQFGGANSAPTPAAQPASTSRLCCRAHAPEQQVSATYYSITSSARARIDGGTVKPSALAVLRLTTSSKVVGCWTGRSAGFSPLRILPA